MTLSNNSNSHTLTIGNNTFLFSYDTLVAMRLDGKLLRTSKNWSNTTSKHINAEFGRDADYESAPQEFFDNYTIK